jgi:hypothetical protein
VSVAAIPSGSLGSALGAAGMQLALDVCAVLALFDAVVEDDGLLLGLESFEPLLSLPQAASATAATIAAVPAERPRQETMTISSSTD